jgi:NAD(P)-dependent dehydrogenase (short-subunit alcohol dehydrogenase family)
MSGFFYLHAKQNPRNMSYLQSFSLEGKVALVTGSSKGIGAAIAQIFAAAGAKVVISSRKQDQLDALADTFAAEGLQVYPIAANVGNPEENQRLVEQTQSLLGSVDILVNNAASNPYFGPLEHTTDAAYDKIMSVNLKAPFDLARLVLPGMEEKKSGSIINISSVEGISPDNFLGMYGVSKAALIALTKSMAREWAPKGIRANVICPGLIKTKFSQALWSNDPLLEQMMHHVPMGRIGTVEEIAGLALFLAAEASSYCTGSVFTADGGYTI